MANQLSITCPKCKKISYHPTDIKFRYCGNCNKYHDQMSNITLDLTYEAAKQCANICPTRAVGWESIYNAFIPIIKAAIEKATVSLERSRDFYKERCDNLQKAQKEMRDPERQIVCDILANGYRDKSIEASRAAQASEQEKWPEDVRYWRVLDKGEKINYETDQMWSLGGSEEDTTWMRPFMPEHTSEPWTVEYVDRLLGITIANGIRRIADAHNATLQREREISDGLGKLNDKLTQQSDDTKRLDWLEEQQALNEAGDSSERWQSWEVTAPADFHGDVREAIDAAMSQTKEKE